MDQQKTLCGEGCDTAHKTPPAIVADDSKDTLPPKKKKGPSTPGAQKKRKAQQESPETKVRPRPSPDCEKCNMPKTETVPSPWHAYLREFTARHPTLSKEEVMMKARLQYVPPSGKKKSFEKLYTQWYMAMHPHFALSKPTPEEISKVVRKAFVKEDFAAE